MYQAILWFIIRLYSQHQNPDTPRIPLKALRIDSITYSNAEFAKTTRLISSIKVKTQNFGKVDPRRGFI